MWEAVSHIGRQPGPRGPAVATTAGRSALARKPRALQKKQANVEHPMSIIVPCPLSIVPDIGRQAGPRGRRSAWLRALSKAPPAPRRNGGRSIRNARQPLAASKVFVACYSLLVICYLLSGDQGKLARKTSCGPTVVRKHQHPCIQPRTTNRSFVPISTPTFNDQD
jgi:hypothetical protein